MPSENRLVAKARLIGDIKSAMLVTVANLNIVQQSSVNPASITVKIESPIPDCRF